MSKTEIFESYKAFLAREDKFVNGVSPEFAKRYSNWRAMNSTNKGCWDCLDCRNCIDLDYSVKCSDTRGLDRKEGVPLWKKAVGALFLLVPAISVLVYFCV